MSKKIELIPSEIAPLLEDTVRNNQILAERGKTGVTYCIEGLAGIAKTAIVWETAQKFPEYHYVKINVSQVEPADLIGYPYVAFEMTKDHQAKWINEKMLTHFVHLGYSPTGETRMDYALPEWLVKANGKKIFLNLDDYSRASSIMINATMELIYTQAYGTWSLPKGSTIFLTTNPGDGDFLVTATDDAQKTRVLFLYAKASVKDWAIWAAKDGIDQRCIDLFLRFPEMIEGTDQTADKQVMKKGNLRNWTLFFNDISYYKEFDPNWTKILNKGSGSFPEEHMHLFLNFIKEKLDKLPTPQEILTSPDHDKMLEKLEELVKDRNDIATLMTKRLFNYIESDPTRLDDRQMLMYRRIIENDKIVTKDLIMQNMKALRSICLKLWKFCFESEKVKKTFLDGTK